MAAQTFTSTSTNTEYMKVDSLRSLSPVWRVHDGGAPLLSTLADVWRFPKHSAATSEMLRVLTVTSNKSRDYSSPGAAQLAAHQAAAPCRR